MQCDVAGHPQMLSLLEAEHFGPMELSGGYPVGFLDLIYKHLGVTDPEQVLHLCSGSIRHGVTVDLRAEMNPKYCCDARRTPFEDGSFFWVMADPAPIAEYHCAVYGLPEDSFPNPRELLIEAARVLQPGGKVCLLSMIEPHPTPGLKHIGTFVPLVGPGFFVRGAFLYERESNGA